MAQHADSPRVETRFTGTVDLVNPLPVGFKQVDYSNPVVTTIIFGRQNPKDGNPVPEHGSLRFRYYSSRRIPGNHIAHVLDPQQLGTLMIKHYAEQNNQRPGNQKHNLHRVKLGDVCKILEDPSLLHKLAKYKDGQAMISLISEHYGQDIIMPLIVVQGLRRHLTVEKGDSLGLGPARLTFDQNTTFWPVVHRKPGDVLVACLAYTFEQNILEVKKHEPLDPKSHEALLKKLFGKNADYTAQGRIKRAMGRQAVETKGTPKLNNVGLQIVTDPNRPPSEVFRYFKEQEIKIDTNRDPRDAIKAMPTRPKNDMWIDKGFPTELQFRFHSYKNDLVAVEKHKSRDGKHVGSGYQHKRLVADTAASGVLVRYEILAPTLPELWDKIGQKPTGPGQVTQFANRVRHQRRVVCEKTGNVFLILADYCRPELSDRTPLSQVEIEYLGTFGFNADANRQNQKQIAADFERVRKVVLKALGSMVTGGHTTKQRWLTATPNK